MGRFHSCKCVVERALRRAFYDGVLELYEGHGGTDTVTAVSLEGMLTLTINKTETVLIRLNEVAQRAEEVVSEDTVQQFCEDDQATNQLKEKENDASRKRKQDSDCDSDSREENKKKVVKSKDVKSEADREDLDVGERESKSSSVDPIETQKEPGSPCTTSQNHLSEQNTGVSLTSSQSTIELEPVCIKREPRDSPVEFALSVSPGPNTSRTQHKESVELREEKADDQIRPQGNSSLPEPPVSILEVKKEPKAESILIEDDDDDSNDGPMDYSTARQASPSRSLWYKLPRGSRHNTSSRRKTVNKHMDRTYQHASPPGMDTAYPGDMALLMERNDCPVCGEVLHSRPELSSHLHAHRHMLRLSCSVCRANTLTLDALLLHLSTVHSPNLLPSLAAAAATTTISSDALLSQALVPTAVPYGPMSAIASLVSMAACQAGPSTAAFLGGGAGAGGMMGGGGMSGLVEQIIAYHGLLPCPICQLLCSSRQHLAVHLSTVHGDPSTPSMGSGQGEVVLTDDAGGDSEAESSSRNDSSSEVGGSGSTSSTFSCFDCSLGFGSQTSYTHHCMLQHGTTSVVSQGSCSICHCSFDTWKALHAHYLSAHAITNFCDRCKMGFSSAAELKSHYDSTHSSETRSLTFICDICNKGFYSQSQCSAHKRSHISEKSFACQVCGSAFFKRGDLSKHFRTVHAPNRVFACRFCGKRGTRMDNMRSHVKSHGKHMTRDEILSFIEEVKS